MRFVMLIFVVLLFASGATLAQGENLAYGDSVVGSLSAEAPLSFFTFSGAAGDRVTVNVIGLSPGLDPAVSLNSPAQQQLASNNSDLTSPNLNDARVTITLTESGVHTVLVSSVGGGTGDFLIRLFGQAAGPSTDISASPVETALTPQTTQVYRFSASPNSAQTLNIDTTTPDFTFGAILIDPDGQVVALLNGSDSAGVSVNVPPGDGEYVVELRTASSTEGQIAISVNPLGQAAPPASDATQQPTVPAPAETEEVGAQQAGPPEGVCSVGAQPPSVNIRSGPGIQYSVLTSLDPGEYFEVTGIYATWYRLDLPNIGIGWARQDVVTTFGPCNTLTIIDSASIPTLPPPSNATPTATTGQQIIEATPTSTATASPTQQGQQVEQATPTYTPTYTPTATTTNAQIAPEDARFNGPLDIELDSTNSVQDVVSYPEGDREDRVRWDVTGMNPNLTLPGGRARLVISVACFGTGTENIEFFTGGQTYSCNQTIVDREVSYDNRTGQVTITAVGGENTYVQWVMTASATRVN